MTERSPVESAQAFLAALASDAPTPGGGAAAALCGAMGAALVAMVGRVTAARDSSVKGAASTIVTQADELQSRLARLATEDMDAYRGVIEARRSGAGPAATERALVRATEVPIRLAKVSGDTLALGTILAPLARKSALSDLAVSAALLWGALESGVLTARANLASVTDTEFVRTSEDELAGLLTTGADARRRLLETVASRARA
jgi:formiminotetrahydrofolate cyclodeaminase